MGAFVFNGGEKFGEIVIEMGLLSQNQVQGLIKIQEVKIPLLGTHLVEPGAMTRTDLVKASKGFETWNKT